MERNAQIDLFLLYVQQRCRYAANRDRGPAQLLDLAPPAGAGRAASLGSQVLSVDRDFHAWPERPPYARLVGDDAIDVDDWHFPAGRAQYKRRQHRT